MINDSPFIVALDHPAVADGVDQFATELRSEQRFFGTTATTAPFPSLINRLTSWGGVRLGSMVDGRLVAMARVEASGDTSIAVVADWRGRGTGTDLLRAVISRSRRLGYERIVLRSTRRGRALAALCSTAGAIAIDRGCGRVDLIISLDDTELSA